MTGKEDQFIRSFAPVSPQSNFKLLGQLSGHSGPIYALNSFKDTVFSGSADGMVASWSADQMASLPFSIKVGQAVYSLWIDEDRILIGQANGGIHVIDREAKQEIRHLQYHRKGVFHMTHNPELNQFYSTGGDGSFSVFTADDYRLLLSLPLADQKLRRLALHPSGQHVAISASDGIIRVLDTNYFNEIARFEAHVGGAYGLIWMNAQTLISGGRDGHIRIWQWDSNRFKLSIEIPAHYYAIYDLLGLSATNFASASRDKSVKIWNTEKLKEPDKLTFPSKHHLRSINAICCVNDKLWSAGDDGLLLVWGQSTCETT